MKLIQTNPTLRRLEEDYEGKGFRGGHDKEEVSWKGALQHHVVTRSLVFEKSFFSGSMYVGCMPVEHAASHMHCIMQYIQGRIVWFMSITFWFGLENSTTNWTWTFCVSVWQIIILLIGNVNGVNPRFIYRTIECNCIPTQWSQVWRAIFTLLTHFLGFCIEFLS